jgi:hypothetical protein
MAMLEADSDGAEVLGYYFCDTVNFVEGCTLPRQGASNFVNKDCAGKAAGD